MSKDGMNYAPEGKKLEPVVRPGEFKFASIRLDHGHINGMTQGLANAGGELKWVWDPDEAKAKELAEKHGAELARSEQEVLDDPEVQLIAAAAVPDIRCEVGLRAMDHGKDYYTDKCPFTTLEQLEMARAKVKETSRKYMVYYGERNANESSIHAGDLIEQGAIGRVLQVMGTGPHRLNAPSRPEWFFVKKHYGGILCDIGSHQIEQFLAFAGAKDAKVVHSAVANFNNKEWPELEDYGEANLVADNGATNYFRVDWFTPEGLPTWGDGRCFILGTEGYIELRKYLNLGTQDGPGSHVFLVNGDNMQHFDVTGKVGFRCFGQIIRDSIDRTDTYMTQEHAFKAAELCMIAQRDAVRIE